MPDCPQKKRRREQIKIVGYQAFNKIIEMMCLYGSSVKEEIQKKTVFIKYNYNYGYIQCITIQACKCITLVEVNFYFFNSDEVPCVLKYLINRTN